LDGTYIREKVILQYGKHQRNIFFQLTSLLVWLLFLAASKKKQHPPPNIDCKQQNHGSLAISQPFLSAGYLANRCSFFSEDSLLFFGFRNMGTLKQKG
jgi:hypothetical protein